MNIMRMLGVVLLFRVGATQGSTFIKKITNKLNTRVEILSFKSQAVGDYDTFNIEPNVSNKDVNIEMRSKRCAFLTGTLFKKECSPSVRFDFYNFKKIPGFTKIYPDAEEALAQFPFSVYVWDGNWKIIKGNQYAMKESEQVLYDKKKPGDGTKASKDVTLTIEADGKLTFRNYQQ